MMITYIYWIIVNARPRMKPFINKSCKYHNNAKVGTITICFRQTDWILERLANLLEIIHLVSGRARIQIQHLGFGVYALNRKMAHIIVSHRQVFASVYLTMHFKARLVFLQSSFLLRSNVTDTVAVLFVVYLDLFFHFNRKITLC